MLFIYHLSAYGLFNNYRPTSLIHYTNSNSGSKPGVFCGFAASPQTSQYSIPERVRLRLDELSVPLSARLARASLRRPGVDISDLDNEMPISSPESSSESNKKTNSNKYGISSLNLPSLETSPSSISLGPGIIVYHLTSEYSDSNNSQNSGHTSNCASPNCLQSTQRVADFTRTVDHGEYSSIAMISEQLKAKVRVSSCANTPDIAEARSARGTLGDRAEVRRLINQIALTP